MKMKCTFPMYLYGLLFAIVVKRIDLFEMRWLNNIQESNYVQVEFMFPSLPSFEKPIQIFKFKFRWASEASNTYVLLLRDSKNNVRLFV